MMRGPGQGGDSRSPGPPDAASSRADCRERTGEALSDMAGVSTPSPGDRAHAACGAAGSRPGRWVQPWLWGDAASSTAQSGVPPVVFQQLGLFLFSSVIKFDASRGHSQN